MLFLCLHTENIFLPFLEQKYVSRMIWNAAGEHEEMTAYQDCCKKKVLDLLSDQGQLDQVLRSLRDGRKTTWSSIDKDNLRIEFNVQRHELACLNSEQLSYWRRQALLFASRLVQNGEYLPRRYVRRSQLPGPFGPRKCVKHCYYYSIKTVAYVRRHVIPHLHYMVAEYPEEDWLTISIAKAIRVLTAGSHVGSEQNKVGGLARARKLCWRTGISDAPVILRRIAVLRQSGSLAEARMLLESFTGDSNTTAGCGGDHGMLILSKTENYANLDRLDDAVRILDTYRPASSASSTYDRLMKYRIQLSKGRLLRYQGQFQAARVVFKEVLRQVQIQSQMASLIGEASMALWISLSTSIQRKRRP